MLNNITDMIGSLVKNLVEITVKKNGDIIIVTDKDPDYGEDGPLFFQAIKTLLG